MLSGLENVINENVLVVFTLREETVREDLNICIKLLVLNEVNRKDLFLIPGRSIMKGIALK